MDASQGEVLRPGSVILQVHDYWYESGAQQSYFLCADDRLRTIGDFQLAVDSKGVGFHRPGADDELPGDLRVGQACGHQAENLTFPGSQEVVRDCFRSCIC